MADLKQHQIDYMQDFNLTLEEFKDKQDANREASVEWRAQYGPRRQSGSQQGQGPPNYGPQYDASGREKKETYLARINGTEEDWAKVERHGLRKREMWLGSQAQKEWWSSMNRGPDKQTAIDYMVGAAGVTPGSVEESAMVTAATYGPPISERAVGARRRRLKQLRSQRALQQALRARRYGPSQ